MAYNLFVAYDLNKPGEKPEDYEEIEKAIAALGPSVRALRSLWYVKSSVKATVAAEALSKVVDATDYLLVTEPEDIAWMKLMPGASEFIKKHWNS